MAHTEENKNRVITVERLDQFYSGISEVFLTRNDADRYYAGINGNANNNFEASTLTASRVKLSNSTEVNYLHTETVPGVSYVEIKDFNAAGNGNLGTVLIPLAAGSQTMATVSQLNGKADKLIPNPNNSSIEFCKQPHIQVFNGVYGDSSNPLSVPRFAVGQVYYFREGTYSFSNSQTVTIANRGFYMVTAVSSAYVGAAPSISAVSFVCAASPYVIYYNINGGTDKLCRYSAGNFIGLDINSGSGPGPDTPVDYDEATSDDIEGIINNYINNTQTE